MNVCSKEFFSFSSQDSSPSKEVGKYRDWRQSGIPSFIYKPLPIDLTAIPIEYRPKVHKLCLEEYRNCNERLDQAIADAALSYVYKNGDSRSKEMGPLLIYSKEMSLRYLSLYKIYVLFQMEKKIPMIPVDAGQLKNQGFLSEEILLMQRSCAQWMESLTPMKGRLGLAEFEKFFTLLTNPEKRAESRDPRFREAIQTYEELGQRRLIDRACFMLFRFGHASPLEVFQQMQAIARMRPQHDASFEERLRMEIRHRVAGDGSFFLGGSGACGSNPLAYLNLLTKGEGRHWEAEFRERMYFLYYNNHFTNVFMENPELLQFANDSLKKNGAQWEIDPHFIIAMNQREPEFLSPLFRYGENAALNGYLREYHLDPGFYEKYPSPLLRDVMRGTLLHSDSSFRHPLSSRELMNQIGDFQIEAISPDRVVPLASGGSAFRIKQLNEIDDSPKGRAAKEYLTMCQELGLPLLSSISGTFDQMATMAAFVGMARSEEEMHILKLALIAFMVPARDHSVQEILQSSQSFGLVHEPGPDFIRYIFPPGKQEFLQKIEFEMEKRRSPFPAYFLSAEHAHCVFQKMRA